VIGYAYACQWAERPAYRWSVETSIYIDGAHQGKGIGRALYAELFDRLRAQRFRIAVAGITLPNPASIRLHELMGFEPIGALRDIGWKDGWHDVGYWQLYLQPPGGRDPGRAAAAGAGRLTRVPSGNGRSRAAASDRAADRERRAAHRRRHHGAEARRTYGIRRRPAGRPPGSSHRGRRLRGARGGHRPRARPRLRLARSRLRRRDRAGGRLRDLHPDHSGLPDRTPRSPSR